MTAPEISDAALDALLDTIAPVEEASPYVRAIIYGDPGVGKTTFAATAPNPLIIAVEPGTLSLTNNPRFADVKVMRYVNVKQLEILAEKAKAGHFNEYDTFIIDTLSELQKRDLDDLVDGAAKKDPLRNKYLPTGPEYNTNTEHMRRILAAFRDLEKHLIVICHVKEEKDESTGRLLVRPDLTPKLAKTAAGMFDVVAYMSASGPESDRQRRMQVHPAGNITAKTRIQGLPPIIEEPEDFGIFLKH